MARVLLISINRCSHPDAVFPLGLAYLNHALHSAGHEVQWLDFLLDEQQLESTLREFQPDCIGISIRNVDDVIIRTRETYIEDLPALCRRIKLISARPIILGGSWFSIFPRELLEFSGADFGIAGAGEKSLCALVEALPGDKDWRATPGLVFREGGRICENPPSESHAPETLLESDRPRDLVNYYIEHGGMMNVQTQRGCAFRCCYCTYPIIEGRTHSRRSPVEVANEFEQIARAGAKYVFITDSVFNSSPGHVVGICEELIRRKNWVRWGCFLRPQSVTKEMVLLMKRAGLAHIEFGSDSLNDEVLPAYEKGFRFADILQASEAAAAAKVDYCHYLIAGGPGETQATLEETHARSSELAGAVFLAVVGMRIYPNTTLHRRALAEGYVTPQDDLLSPVYYVSPAIGEAGAFELLRSFARQTPSWVVVDPAPGYLALAERLRRRGVVGPLWSYWSMIQQLWPEGFGNSMSSPAARPQN